MAMRNESSNSKWWLLGIGSTLALGLSILTRSKKLEPKIEYRLHVLNEQKFVEADPEGLANAAQVPLEVYALASIMQSEDSSDKARLAIGLATRNAVRKAKTTIAQLALSSIRKGKKYPSHGYFGSQEAPGKQVATSKPPTAKTLLLAKDILSDKIKDITHGAIQWDAPAAQDAKHKENPKVYPNDSKAVAKKRIAAGAREIWVPGVLHTRFWTYT
jgi:hypothetical protein